MKRLLWVMVGVVLLGGCANEAISQKPLRISLSHPTTSMTQRVEPQRQVNRMPVIPRRLYSRVVGSAPVVPLFLEGDALVPPGNPQILGWWGQKAGSTHGVILLVGHTVHTGGGFLDDLEEVALGTDINISGVHYTVTSNRVISKAALARRAPRLFSQQGSHRLVVVTCEDYDPATGHYSSNVVLIAK